MLFIELECVPQFWVRKMGMAWGPRGVASPVCTVTKLEHIDSHYNI